jgi:hypothetical protein
MQGHLPSKAGHQLTCHFGHLGPLSPALTIATRDEARYYTSQSRHWARPITPLRLDLTDDAMLTEVQRRHLLTA